MLKHLQEGEEANQGQQQNRAQDAVDPGVSEPTSAVCAEQHQRKIAVTLILFAQVPAAPPRLSTSRKTHLGSMDKSRLQRPSEEREPATVGASQHWQRGHTSGQQGTIAALAVIRAPTRGRQDPTAPPARLQLQGRGGSPALPAPGSRKQCPHATPAKRTPNSHSRPDEKGDCVNSLSLL